MAGEKRLGTLTLVMILASLNVFAAGKDTGAGALGWITGKESVWINEQPALPGTAVFSGDVIQTGKSARAVVSLPSGTSAALSQDSEVALGLESDRTSLELRRGAVAGTERRLAAGAGERAWSCSVGAGAGGVSGDLQDRGGGRSGNGLQ